MIARSSSLLLEVEIALNEIIDLAIHYSGDVPSLAACTMILHKRVGLEYIASDLVSP